MQRRSYYTTSHHCQYNVMRTHWDNSRIIYMQLHMHNDDASPFISPKFTHRKLCPQSQMRAKEPTDGQINNNITMFFSVKYYSVSQQSRITKPRVPVVNMRYSKISITRILVARLLVANSKLAFGSISYFHFENTPIQIY